MRGKYKVIIANNKLHYEFEIKRNITIIRGDSATGKTTLINMISQFENLGRSSGVNISCDVPCRVINGANWKLVVENSSKCIFFLDEENSFINTEEFASTIKTTDNYYVIVTRENLYNLPYSVEEIYGIHTSGKYLSTKKVFQQFFHIYSSETKRPVLVSNILVEDSNSGYEFFKEIALENGFNCNSANGKSNIFSRLQEMDREDMVCVIADGAAFGPEMDRVFELVQNRKNISLYLPESFEWIILKSGVLNDTNISQILENPEDYIDSKEYFSWERYFTQLLVGKTKDTYLSYSKSKLNKAYIEGKTKVEIVKSMKGIDLENNLGTA